MSPKLYLNFKRKEPTMLTIRELAPYLPYGLKVLQPDGRTILELEGIVGNLMVFQEVGSPHLTYGSIGGTNRPLLRPLSSLTKEIKVNGERFVPIYKLGEVAMQKLPEGFTDERLAMEWVSISIYMHYEEWQYWLMQQLLEWHFDVFGLIERSLAIEITA